MGGSGSRSIRCILLQVSAFRSLRMGIWKSPPHSHSGECLLAPSTVSQAVFLERYHHPGWLDAINSCSHGYTDPCR